MPILIVPLVFIALIGLEIAVYIKVGNEIGIGWTLGLTVLTAIGGMILLRLQGFHLIERIRAETSAGRVPKREIAHGAMMLVAALLLLSPGFVTDCFGFILLIPFVRDGIYHALKGRFRGAPMRQSSFSSASGRNMGEEPNHPASKDEKPSKTIELDSDNYTINPDSPWRDKH